MTHSRKRTDEDKLAAAPIQFTLGGELIEAPPLDFGEASVWLADALDLMATWEVTYDDLNGIGKPKSDGVINVGTASRQMRSMPEVLALLFRFAGIDATRAERINSRMKERGFAASYAEVDSAFGLCMQIANPPKGPTPNGRATVPNSATALNSI